MRILFNLVLLFLPLLSIAQTKDHFLHNIQVDVVYLASDYLEGRQTGTKGEELAASYISRRFSDLGLMPKGGEGSWYQEFPWAQKINPHADTPENIVKGTGKNVVAYLDKGATNTVVIGAHYDHLGMGAPGSLHAGDAMIHNGADDNASGIAAMLMIAQKLKDQSTNSNFLFIAFSGEEIGLYGSKYFAENPTINLSTMNYMINMDMVGKLNDEHSLVINGVGTSPVWKPAFERIDVDEIKVITTDSGIGPSDHTSFYLQDIPAIHFFTGNHEHYHKPSDDVGIVNFDGIVSVSNYILALINELDDEGKIAFTQTKEDDKDKKVADFKVTLGVMPDYVYQGTGMRIDGVIGGRVADVAGMKKGDIVIKIGDKEVKDIYAYMDALAMYKKGDKAKVTIKRDGKELVKKVVW